MGLDSLLNKEGYVHSDKDTEDLNFSRHSWKALLQYHPQAAYILLTRETRESSGKEESKLFIELIDEIIEEDGAEGTISDNEIGNLKHARKELVDRIEE